MKGLGVKGFGALRMITEMQERSGSPRIFCLRGVCLGCIYRRGVLVSGVCGFRDRKGAEDRADRSKERRGEKR